MARAAEAASYAIKPILLFYALSQGYRAVCAARLRADWERSGHGLAVPHRGSRLLDVAVVSAPSKADLYHGAIEAVDEPPLQGEVSLREVWTSMPELTALDALDGLGPKPLTLYLLFRDDELSDPTSAAPATSLFVLIEGDVEAQSADKLRHSLATSRGKADGSFRPG